MYLNKPYHLSFYHRCLLVYGFYGKCFECSAICIAECGKQKTYRAWALCALPLPIILSIP